MKKLLILFAFIILFTVQTTAHPGRTDKYGGHTESATGQYHIHNDDGTITYTTKPSDSTQKNTQIYTPDTSSQNGTNSIQQQSPAPSYSDVQQTSPEPQTEQPMYVPPVTEQEPITEEILTEPNSEPQASNDANQSSIIVGDVTKPLQDDVSPNATDTNPENKATVYRQVNGNGSPLQALSTVGLSLLVIFALIGICIVSSIVQMAIKKLEGKSENIDFLLYIPTVLVVVPAFLGNALMKIYHFLERTKVEENRKSPYSEDDFIRRSNYPD